MSNTQIYTASVTLNDAQIKALPTVNGGSSGLEIVPAPGPGKIILFMNALVSCDTTEGIYENIDVAAGAKFGLTATVDSSLVVRESLGALSDWLQFEANTFVLFPSKSNFDNGLGNLVPPPVEELDGLENVSLKFHMTNTTGDFTGGHASNSMKITVIYTIIDV